MNDWVLAVLGASVFLASAFILEGLSRVFRASRERRSKDLARRLGTLGATDSQATALRLQAQDQLAGRLGTLGAHLASTVEQAGGSTDLRQLLRSMVGMALLGLFLLALLLRSPVCILGVLLGVFPVIRLRIRAQRRSEMLSEQLPNALDLLARSLQAGHGMADGLRLCADEMPHPISSELGRVYEEHNLGRDFRESVQNLIRRNPDNFDIKIFGTSVLVARETGGNLVEILNNIADTVRARFLFRGKVKALTAEARFSAFVLGGLPVFVAVMVSFTRPEYLLPLLQDPLGRAFLVYGICSYLAGILVMRRLARIDD